MVFAALPHGLFRKQRPAAWPKGKKFIDLGADFRLDDPVEYEKWYGCDYILPELHEQAVYGLPELFRAEIAGKSVVGNPAVTPPASPSVSPRARAPGWRAAGDRDRLKIRRDRRGPGKPRRAPIIRSATRHFPRIRWLPTATRPRSSRP